MASSKSLIEALREPRGRFREAHAQGTAALAAGDYQRLTKIIHLERRILEEQRLLLRDAGVGVGGPSRKRPRGRR